MNRMTGILLMLIGGVLLIIGAIVFIKNLEKSNQPHSPSKPETITYSKDQVKSKSETVLSETTAIAKPKSINEEEAAPLQISKKVNTSVQSVIAVEDDTTSKDKLDEEKKEKGKRK